MQKLSTSVSLCCMVILTTTIIALLSCGGGGGGIQSSTINGTVADVVTTMAPMKEKSFILTLIKKNFSFSEKANAQGSEVAGIEVKAEVNGKEVANDTTGPDGSFELTVPGGGNVTLIFNTGDFTVSTEIITPEGGIVNIVVTLEPALVTIDEEEVEGSIHCGAGIIQIKDLMINGGGENCIAAEGNCSFIITGNITATDCKRCVDAEDEAQLTLGSLTCDASEDGIRTEGDSDVVLVGSTIVTISAQGNGIETKDTSRVSMNIDGAISISGGEDGIRSEGNAEVILNAISSLPSGGSINISGGENGIRAEDTSEVNVGAGNCTIQGGADAIQVKGDAIVNALGCVLVLP